MTTKKQNYNYPLTLPPQMEAPLKILSYLQHKAVNTIITEAVRNELNRQLKTYSNDNRSNEIIDSIQKQLNQFKVLVKNQ